MEDRNINGQFLCVGLSDKLTYIIKNNYSDKGKQKYEVNKLFIELLKYHVRIVKQSVMKFGGRIFHDIH